MIAPLAKKTWIACGLLAAFLAAGCSTEPMAPRPAEHVVLMWMNHPQSKSDRAQLMRAARKLRLVPGVVSAEIGTSVPPLPPGVDRTFDLAAVITFRSRAALARFERSPRRQAALERYLLPLVRHYEVYNLDAR